MPLRIELVLAAWVKKATGFTSTITQAITKVMPITIASSIFQNQPLTSGRVILAAILFLLREIRIAISKGIRKIT
ncbi:MAG: hypothetical protein BWX76_00670 [Candidatus Cloacimonetes bacterium ADurb.Bin089]|nr:MAG: hypothetical protein BWX76_00670 [Candidatus Cloacimonetes bacterium ADurb.Bin089]